MKSSLLKFSYFGAFGKLHILTAIVALCFALLICSVSQVEAQRHGGHNREPSWHYSRMPAHGAYIHRLPHAAYRIPYGGNVYHFRHGFYYRPFNNGFILTPPPFGLRIGILPRGFLSFNIGGFPYYYYGGTYYIQRDHEYEVVAPPLGAIVESIPHGYEKVIINGETFYILGGVQYRPIMRNGEIWYEVIKSPNR
jgi:Family of unknown function (DUF6515)